MSYDNDLKLVREVLTQAVLVLKPGDSSVDFAVRPWTKAGDYWTVLGDLPKPGKAELEAIGCSIPYPQRDVHLNADHTATA